MKTLLIIDGNNWLARAFHAVPPSATKAGAPTNAVHGFCQMLLKADRELAPDFLAVVFDSPGKNFRHELYPDYKATRPPRPVELSAQVPVAMAAAEAYGCIVYQVPGVEADDVIATLAREASATDGMATVIGSSDKDLLQLCAWRGVTVLDAKGNRIGALEVEEKWGVMPSKLADVLALMGDTDDNVPGVEGVGAKTAAELIRTYGKWEAVVANAYKIGGKKGFSIAASSDVVALARRLVTLKEDVDIQGMPGELKRDPDRLRRFYAEILEMAPPASLDWVRSTSPGHVPPPTPSSIAQDAPKAPTKKISFEAKIGDVLRWDDKACSVILVGDMEAVNEFRQLRDRTVRVTVEL